MPSVTRCAARCGRSSSATASSAAAGPVTRTATAARNADLEIRESGDLAWIPSPRSEYDAGRGFCTRCGASLFWRAPGFDRTSIAAGTLDDPSGLRIAAHIWVEQGADWERPPEGIPAYRRGYPDDAPRLAWG